MRPRRPTPAQPSEAVPGRPELVLPGHPVRVMPERSRIRPAHSTAGGKPLLSRMTTEQICAL
ncbi:hypothetical protein ACIBKZ_28200 [Streptomyces sp. NPDC050421]|uniref:hypothetical protein n=1 Tax=Streptomyces sp. NPDC050421 TaxID=3365613 RepID=UPI00379C8E76